MFARRLSRFAALALALAACANAAPGRERAEAWPSAVAGPVVPPAGYVAGDAAVVRRTPRSRSPVVATLDRDDREEALVILGRSGDYVHVRRGAVEGWAKSGDVLARTLAVAFDATTGATVAITPVGATQHDVAFSPDGSRAVVYGYVSAGAPCAYEVATRDFAPTRTIVATGSGGDPAQIVGVFFGGRDGRMYAAVRDESAPESSRLAIVRVRERGEPAEPPAWRGAGSDLTVSPDGRLGFVFSSAEYGPDGRPAAAAVDVVDLRALATRNTIALSGELAHAFVAPEPNADGSELYLFGDVSRLRVVDAATGREVRQVTTGFAPNSELVLENSCAGGRSLLLTALGNPCESTIPEGAWWISGAARAPAPALACAVDTGTARYGIGDGSRLLRLGTTTAIRDLAPLPKALEPPAGHEIWSWSMAASPDGRRLVLFVSFAEEFCPC
jgi:hypothetical protein